MKQIYYVIQTLLRGRGSNIIKIISLGLSLTMSIYGSQDAFCCPL